MTVSMRVMSASNGYKYLLRTCLGRAAVAVYAVDLLLQRERNATGSMDGKRPPWHDARTRALRTSPSGPGARVLACRRRPRRSLPLLSTWLSSSS